jgi:hypothetical protein
MRENCTYGSAGGGGSAAPIPIGHVNNHVSRLPLRLRYRWSVTLRAKWKIVAAAPELPNSPAALPGYLEKGKGLGGAGYFQANFGRGGAFIQASGPSSLRPRGAAKLICYSRT